MAIARPKTTTTRKDTASFSVSKAGLPDISYGEPITITITGTVKSVGEHPVDYAKPNGQKYVSFDIEITEFRPTDTLSAAMRGLKKK